MQVIRSVQNMQALADALRQEGRRLALVPTMGALHEGHHALIDHARQHADTVVVSIFVNPTQFAPGEDFDRYPRRLDEDLEELDQKEVDLVFAPSDEAMYPTDGEKTWIEVADLGDRLCGAHRPGHFRGVTTVVAKLFNACKPHVAVFGLKDAQQFVMLRRMTSELLFDVELIGVPTVRAFDGLALSSRNAYLSEEDRRDAVVLSRAVEEARRRVLEGEQHVAGLVEAMREKLSAAPQARIQYTQVVDAETLAPIERVAPGQEVIAAVAVYFGDTRLIDNAFARLPGGEPDDGLRI